MEDSLFVFIKLIYISNPYKVEPNSGFLRILSGFKFLRLKYSFGFK